MAGETDLALVTDDDKVLTDEQGRVLVYVAPGPQIPDPYLTNDRHANWAIYEDGTLVINGDNELQNDHGNLKACSNMVYYATFPEPAYMRYAPVYLDNTIGDFSGYGWWDGNYALPSLIEAIGRVEFAKSTAPTSMCGWFINAPYLWEIDSTNLDTSQLTNTSWMFAMINATRKMPFPILGDWNVSNLMNAVSMFMFGHSTVDIVGSHPVIGSDTHKDVLGLQNWKVHDGCNTYQMFYTPATDAMSDSAWLYSIFCDNTWNCDGKSMFAGQYNLLSMSGEFATYEGDHISGEMANPNTGYFTTDIFTAEEQREMYTSAYSDFVPPFDWSQYEDQIISFS